MSIKFFTLPKVCSHEILSCFHINKKLRRKLIAATKRHKSLGICSTVSLSHHSTSASSSNSPCTDDCFSLGLIFCSQPFCHWCYNPTLPLQKIGISDPWEIKSQRGMKYLGCQWLLPPSVYLTALNSESLLSVTTQAWFSDRSICKSMLSSLIVGNVLNSNMGIITTANNHFEDWMSTNAPGCMSLTINVFLFYSSPTFPTSGLHLPN